jgi:hypothetical protein
VRDRSLIDLVLQEVATEGLVDVFLQVPLVQDATRLAIGIEHREKGLMRIATEKLEDAVDRVVFVDRRQHFDLLADQDFVERLRIALALAKVQQMRE